MMAMLFFSFVCLQLRSKHVDVAFTLYYTTAVECYHMTPNKNLGRVLPGSQFYYLLEIFKGGGERSFVKYHLILFHQVKNSFLGSSLVAQWLGLQAFTAMVQVQSLIEKLRFHKPNCEAKKKKKELYKKCNNYIRSQNHPVGELHNQ